MRTMEFTPGPWKVGYRSESGKRNGALIYEEKTQGNIAHIWATLRSIEECDRNAELIAAAPELYEACKAASEWGAIANDLSEWEKKVWTKLESAIAKAERKGP